MGPTADATQVTMNIVREPGGKFHLFGLCLACEQCSFSNGSDRDVRVPSGGAQGSGCWGREHHLTVAAQLSSEVMLQCGQAHPAVFQLAVECLDE